MSLLRRLFTPTPPPPPPVRVAPRLTLPSDVFTPSAPKTGRRLVGRAAELERILQALEQDRTHVVLYAERGRGKTSLANVVVEALRRKGVIVARHTCEAGSTFESIMRGLMADLPHSLLTASGGHAGEGCEAALPPGELRPRDIVTLPKRLACRSLICVMDEFDRVEDEATRTKLADSIKQLSDRDASLLFVVVGVSRDLDQILGQHPSIQRSLTGIHLPLFTDRDIAQIIIRGGRETGYEFSPAAAVRITVLARGMPYVAQLLGLRLTQAAAARGDRTVSEEDFATAVIRMIEDAPTRVVSLYGQITNHGRDADMVLSLRRVATAPQDPWGRLHVMEADGGVMVSDRMIPPYCWDRICDAGVLQLDAPGSELYSFAERGLMHHTLLLAARDVTSGDQPGLEAHAPDLQNVASLPATGPSGLHPALSRG